MAEQYHFEAHRAQRDGAFRQEHSLWEIWRNFFIGALAIAASSCCRPHSNRARNPNPTGDISSLSASWPSSSS